LKAETLFFASRQTVVRITSGVLAMYDQWSSIGARAAVARFRASWMDRAFTVADAPENSLAEFP
jgi:hypothetical protein